MDQTIPSVKDIWDERFSAEEYAYGEEPNEWFREKLATREAGNLLLPAEGEGRNAVYAARQSWFVTAYDLSAMGIKKAAKLAKKHHVMLKYEKTSHEAFQAPPVFFDCIALIYTHIPPSIRTEVHQKLLRYLKPGGILIIEGFSVNQLGKPSGGPKDPEWLYTPELLKADFAGMKEVEAFETDVTLNEGAYHQGPASVVRFYGVK